MKIYRQGSYANHGTSHIELRHINVKWNADEQVITIKSDNIGDFSTQSTHDYTLKIRIDELSKIINALGIEGVEKSSEFIEEKLGGELKALNRIIAAASGLLKK